MTVKKIKPVALISVYNKDGIVKFAKALVRMGWRIISSGGTAKKLSEAGISVTDVAEITGFPPILDHRVVTLHPKVHGGLLALLENTDHQADMEKYGIDPIGMVVCDFYPMRDAINQADATIKSVIEKTDIGGPTMVNAAAKGGRIVVCRLEDRQLVLDELKHTGYITNGTLQDLRARAFYETGRYYMNAAIFHGDGQFVGMMGELVIELPKGENAHQAPAGLYSTGSDDSLAVHRFKLVEGNPLSYNNICDVDRMLQTFTHILEGFRKNFGTVPCIGVGVKHGNPCGAAAGDDPYKLVTDVVTGDRRAIFGGFLLFNFKITVKMARAMAKCMAEGRAAFDGVIAPGFTGKAIEVLSRTSGKCRIITNPALVENESMMDTTPRIRQVRGGLLLQPNYTYILNLSDSRIKSFGPALTGKRRQEDIILAHGICSTSNSNTLTIVNGRLIGNGVGQQDRVGAAALAVSRALDAGHADELVGAIACSDSFFPFVDAVKVLAEAGIKVIFSTSGSRNDENIQQFCEENGITLVQLPDSIARGFFGH